MNELLASLQSVLPLGVWALFLLLVVGVPVAWMGFEARRFAAIRAEERRKRAEVERAIPHWDFLDTPEGRQEVKRQKAHYAKMLERVPGEADHVYQARCDKAEREWRNLMWLWRDDD